MYNLPAAASETARAIAELDTVRFRPIISSNSASLNGGGPSGRCSGGGAPYCGYNKSDHLITITVRTINAQTSMYEPSPQNDTSSIPSVTSIDLTPDS
jgi:hypothetical protein